MTEVMGAGGEESRRQEDASEVENRRRMFAECCVDEEGSAVAVGIKFPVKTM